MNETLKQVYAQEYFDYLKNRGFIRASVRKIYLHDIKKCCIGKTIDFGCGTGQLLGMLPKGSIGFDVNEVAVNYCNEKGLQVALYDPEMDDYNFHMIPPDVYSSFTMNHVLEHIAQPDEVMEKIFKSCDRLGIKRLVFTVPGFKNFAFDATHETFIDKEYMKEHHLLNNAYYLLKTARYFPFNWDRVDHYFRHNELRFVFDKK